VFFGTADGDKFSADFHSAIVLS